MPNHIHLVVVPETKNGNSDAVLSGELAWEYASKRMAMKTWQCQYIDFAKEDHIRLRPGAPSRPKGFYYVKSQPGQKYLELTVKQVLNSNQSDTECRPERIQFLTITHPHFAKMVDQRKIPFMAFADYDVAPYGFNVFLMPFRCSAAMEPWGSVSAILTKTIPSLEFPLFVFSHLFPFLILSIF